ncbi:hypothetical protein EP7_004008 [Isosphaeraceae bacterium EP7]
MRFRWFTLLVMLAGLTASESRAQTTPFSNDPFALYFGFFLPRQQALANQPGPEATINENVAARQSYAVTNQGSLTDPGNPFAGADDPFSDSGVFAGTRRPGERMPRLSSTRSLPFNHVNGAGPPQHYNRVVHYFPNARTGRGANQYVAPAHRRTTGPSIPYANNTR